MQKPKLQFRIQNYLVAGAFIFITALPAFAAMPVFAANLFFGAETNEVRTGEHFEVKLFVNTPEESANAFEGKITFPNDLLDLKEVRDGNTIVNFWIEKPKAQNNAIAFSGITPGGFQGSNGLLFSAVFEAKSEGVARFEINDARVLRNDGTGSPAALTTAPFEMAVSSEAPLAVPAVTKVKDTEPPESFVPEIAHDPAIFDGKWFLVFATQDKVSGIDRYEIKETRQKFFTGLSGWVRSESPYILQDQELRSHVFVKAVDKAGNERVMKINSQNPLRWYENYENWLIVIMGFVIAYATRKLLWRKK